MKLILAMLVCKLARFVGKLVGRGSSLPGQLALKVCPDVLGRVELPDTIIAVTGSNGKTSTVELAAAMLRAGGLRVVCNEEGSNQIEGVATLILSHCTLSGRLRADVLLLESDERYAQHTFRYFKPTHFVVTNLYRDQLTRNGHPEWVYECLKAPVSGARRLVLNADDPLVSCFAWGREESVTWFGVERCPADEHAELGVYDDGAYCPKCHAPMRYEYRHYHHIGSYQCGRCGHARHAPDCAVTALDLAAGSMTIDGEQLKLGFRSIYNVYNILAAWTVCALCGVDKQTLAKVAGGYVLKNGRLVTFRLGAHPGTLLTSKHENSVAYDTNLGYIAGQGQPCEVMVIVDAISRKYFTGETSWLWDVDFSLLAGPHVKRVWLCGRYVHDLAMRFDYAGVPPEKIECRADIAAAARELERDGELPLYVVTCFSDRDKLLSLTQRD